MFRKLKVSVEAFGREIKFYQGVLKHPKTPRLAKWLLGLGIAYFFSPIDLIPDFIPILGQLDDLLIVPTLVFLAIKLIPKEVLLECRLYLDIPMKTHWENIYKTKSSKDVSWYAHHLEKSLQVIKSLGLPKEAEIIDVGGGASTLPDDLLDKGYINITALDISSQAFKVSKDRLGNRANSVHWLEADVTQASLKSNHYDLWHDRAVFHFLTKVEDRQKYVNKLSKALKPGGHVLIATFGPNGPLKCSGLEIVRYSAQSLEKELGASFKLEQSFAEIHKTPFDTTQEFLYALFRKQYKPLKVVWDTTGIPSLPPLDASRRY